MKKSKELGRNIAESLAHWNYLKEHGGQDPFWSDGTNMNLVRNHVIYYKKQCESELDPKDYPPEYQLEIPPEVDNAYMARAEEIRENAQKALEAQERDPDYLWLTANIRMMTKKQIQETGIMHVIHYPAALRFAIEKGDLVTMRRSEDPEKDREPFKSCRAKVEEILAEGKEKELPIGQLTLFDLDMI